MRKVLLFVCRSALLHASMQRNDDASSVSSRNVDGTTESQRMCGIALTTSPSSGHPGVTRIFCKSSSPLHIASVPKGDCLKNG
jgi:hypothetical protein